MSVEDIHLPLVIFGVPFHPVTLEQTVQRCLQIVDRGIPGFVATPNLDFVMHAQRDPELYRILARADLVIADGMPIVWLAKFLGPALQERVAGSDLVIHLAEAAAAAGKSVYHLGGAPGVPEKAAEVLCGRFPGLKIAGCFSPPKADLLEMDQEAILNRLEEAHPDILYVAFGAPKQEKWINLHVRDWKVGLALGIGGSLDFLAGAQKRAPEWMQKTGTEWIWRLASNPKRLWKRYGSNLIFLGAALIRVWAIRLRSGSSPEPLSVPESWVPRRKRWTPFSSEAEARTTFQDWGGEGPVDHLLIDFAGCAWLDSRELGVLMALGRVYREAGKELMVSGRSRRIQRWMDFNGLERLTTAVSSVEDLLALEAEEDVQRSAVEGGVLRLRLPDELTAANLSDWKQEVLPLWRESEGLTGVVADAGGLRFLDSAGLGGLVGMCKQADEEGVDFRVTGLQGAPLTTVKLARLEEMLTGE